MSHPPAVPLVDESELAEARAALGAGLPRILGYFREDGPQSIARIEAALDADDAAAMVAPADTLKSEARQFGGQRLGDLAEAIELAARRCVEAHGPPTQLAGEVAMLRGCFAETLALLEAHVPAEPTRAVARGAALGARPRLFGRRIIS